MYYENKCYSKMNGKCHTGNDQVKDAKKGKLEGYDWT